MSLSNIVEFKSISRAEPKDDLSQWLIHQSRVLACEPKQKPVFMFIGMEKIILHIIIYSTLFYLHTTVGYFKKNKCVFSIKLSKMYSSLKTAIAERWSLPTVRRTSFMPMLVHACLHVHPDVLHIKKYFFHIQWNSFPHCYKTFSQTIRFPHDVFLNRHPLLIDRCMWIS